jgi:hypothetical protein
MWGVLVGIYIIYIVYPFFEEWRQHRVDRRRLANMREHFKLGHRWDVAKGQSMDDRDQPS